MKKVISMVLTAAMVASLVPATAFAAANVSATAEIIGAKDLTKDQAKDYGTISEADDRFWDDAVPELLLEVTKANYVGTNPTTESFEITLEFDNAEVIDYNGDKKVNDTEAFPADMVSIWKDEDSIGSTNHLTTDGGATGIVVSYKDVDADGFTVVLTNTGSAATDRISKDNVIAIDLESVLTKTTVGTVATVDVESDFGDWEGLAYVTVEGRGITATTKKVGNVAEEEHTKLAKDVKITSNVGNFADGQKFELKLSNGFEFLKGSFNNVTETAYTLTFSNHDDDVVEVVYNVVDGQKAVDEIEIPFDAFEIEAVSAKADATCVMTVKAVKQGTVTDSFTAKTTVEVLKVVDYAVILSVDEDEDVPVIYSGVNVNNFGITDDSDHLSLEITAEETFPGAWSFRKGFNFELPEGVYVTDVKVIEQEGFLMSKTDAVSGATPVTEDEMMEAFVNAYQEGDHVNFEFEKRVFDDVDSLLGEDEATLTFQLELVADPTFVGDVTLKLTGELVDEQEVVIAKFAPVYTVAAEQNDLKIDYRYTEIPTEIVITETEAGLWKKGEAAFGLYVEKPDYIVFEDDPVYTVTGGMELDNDELMTIEDVVQTYLNTPAVFPWDAWDDDTTPAIMATVDKESDEAATITISGMSLFMQRSIPAGPYDLKGITSMAVAYELETLFAPDCYSVPAAGEADWDNASICLANNNCGDCQVTDVCDYSDVAKEAFVNVVTAGREADDASFTTIVQVPVGELYLVAGENTVELDVPAYINANGYTMLPVRAVATALGINNNNVLWDQATKTVTILYGQRIITMQVGANVVYVNGSAIPATSSVEIVDGRTFLGLRDLATALGVTTIDWDAASKTALLNAEFEA